MNKKICWLLVFILLIVIATGAGIFINYYFQKEVLEAGLTPQDNQANKEVNVWQNDRYGFTFEYPKDWTVHMGDATSEMVQLSNQNAPSGDGGPPLGVQVELILLPSYPGHDLIANAREFRSEGLEREVEVAEQELVLNGRRTIKYVDVPTFPELNEGAPVEVYFIIPDLHADRMDRVVLIKYMGREPDYSQNLDNFDKILKSFNLIKH